MMRSTLLSLLVASASAFAPVQQVCSFVDLKKEWRRSMAFCASRYAGYSDAVTMTSRMAA
jgi:hypothetical protein